MAQRAFCVMYKLIENPARSVANSELYDPHVTNKTNKWQTRKAFRATVIILESKKTRRRHSVTEEEWTKLMPNRDISEEFTDSTYTSNGRICIIQNGPQENCCIFIHMRQLWFTGFTTEPGRKTEFCELVASCVKEKHNPHTRFERRSLV